MNIEGLYSLLTSVGFPIVCCVYMWKYINTTMDEFTRTIDRNTQMLSRICDRLDMWKTEKKEGE